jgi:23S rRNA (guanosine2251-2'-O)-methyltransferase
MKEWLYGRNAVYETLRSHRRQLFRLRLAQGVEEKGRLAEILRLASERRLPVERVTRASLEPLQRASRRGG